MNPDKLAELAKLRESSMEILQGLQRDGVGELSLGNARMEMFIECILPWGTGGNEMRVDFELTWERKVAEVLEQVRSDVARAKLTQGVSLVPPVSANGHR